jgi:hypothetical protein
MQSGLLGIAAPVGVGNLRYRPAGARARARTAQSKLRDVVSILDFGGSGDGVTDNAPAIAAAFAALVARGGTGGTIHFPVGKYRFNSSVTLTLPSGLFSLTLVGEGADATVLHWPTTAGLVIACSNQRHSVHVRDMTYTTGAANAGSGLRLTNSVLLGVIMQSDVTRCTFRGDDGGAISNYWSIGVEVIGLSLISFCDVLSYGPGVLGVGISVTGNAVTSPNFGIIYNFDRCTFLSHGIGIQYDSYIQGVSVSQCNFTNCTTGINVPAGAIGITQLAVTTSQFDCTNVNIFVQSPIAGLMITNSLFYIASNGVGIVCSSTGFQNSITGNVFSGEPASVATIGISISGNITGSCVVGNTFYNLVTGTDLGGTATWLVDKNVYDATTTPIANVGTNRAGPDFVIGLGGSVTQATNKATGVTLNRRCGQILMNNAALAAGATVSFVFTNSFLTALSTFVIRNSGSVGTAGAYRVQERANGVGSVQIDITNITGGSLSEAIVLNFAVMPIAAA